MRLRELNNPLGTIARVLLIGMPFASIVYVVDLLGYLGKAVYPQQFMGLFLLFLLPAIFLLAPATRKASKTVVPWYDIILAFLGAIIGGYLIIFYPDVSVEIGVPSVDRAILGAIAVFLVLEGTRRLVGWPVVIIALFFIFYARFCYILPGALGGRGFDWQRILIYLYLQPDSLLGIPLYVGSTIVAAFIFFGQGLIVTGGTEVLSDGAMAIMGRFSGGPAKVAVLGSGLFGTLSGSAVSDVAATGSVTIPMMLKGGYPPHLAAAVEAVASSGGAIMPPIMGAAAFIMAEFLQIPYSDVVITAIIPALFYYLVVFLQVHLHSKRAGLKGLPTGELPSIRVVLKDGWPYGIPAFALIVFLFYVRLTAGLAGVYAGIVVLLVGMLIKRRLTLKGTLTVLERTGRVLLDIGIICCSAGFIIGMISLSGLSSVMSNILISAAGGHLFLLLVLAAASCIVLGMGMPITASYVLLAVFVVPAIIRIGVLPIAAHLFIIYFSVMSFITPPVCLAVYTAAGIAHSEPMKTGLESMKLAIAAYVIPFVFVYNPSMILKGRVSDTLLSVLLTFLGSLLCVVGLQGFAFQRISTLVRASCLVVALIAFWLACVHPWSVGG